MENSEERAEYLRFHEGISEKEIPFLIRSCQAMNHQSHHTPSLNYFGYFRGLTISFLCAAVIFSGCTSSSFQPAPVASPVPLAEYHRAGGIAGIIEYLYIFENGTAISSKIRNGTITLNQSEINEIDDILRRAPVISQKAEENSSRKMPDMIHFSVRYRGNEVRAPDPAIRKLQEILNRAPGR